MRLAHSGAERSRRNTGRSRQKMGRFVPTLILVGGLLGLSAGSASAATLNTWSPAGTLGTSRTGATAVLLGNGQVLVAGGITGTIASDNLATTAELYNPATNAWTPTGTGAPVVSNAVAALLPNGNVLVAGGAGSGGTATNAVEIYNPATNAWSGANALPAQTPSSVRRRLRSGTDPYS